MPYCAVAWAVLLLPCEVYEAQLLVTLLC